MNKTELKGCAFCGETSGLESIITQEFKEKDWEPHRVIGCEYCEICGPTGSSPEDAIRHWNHRPLESAHLATIARQGEVMREAAKMMLMLNRAINSLDGPPDAELNELQCESDRLIQRLEAGGET